MIENASIIVQEIVISLIAYPIQKNQNSTLNQKELLSVYCLFIFNVKQVTT